MRPFDNCASRLSRSRIARAPARCLGPPMLVLGATVFADRQESFAAQIITRGLEHAS